MVPFAVQARRGCSTPCHLALALAAEFAPVRPVRAEHTLDELAGWLVAARDDHAADQLHALAHRELPEPLLVDPARGALRDARTLESPVSWQCCHQLAARILNRIGERAERVGQVCWALRAAELRLALPFEGPVRERLEADLRRVRARLN
jgi:hypothetical protein